MSEEKPPDLPTYVNTGTFIHPKQQGPLNKLIGKMLKPKMRTVMRSAMKNTKNKHKVHFY